MSVFIVPVHDNYHRRPTYSRCSPSYGSQSAWDVNPYHRRNAIPHSLFGTLFDVAEDDSQDTLMSLSPSPFEQHIAAIRRQEYLEEVQRRQRLIARQQQLEYVREQRERIRRERERAARSAWEEHQRRAAIEYQRRLQAYKRQQEEAHAERVQLAKRRQAEWDQFASHALVGVIDFVEQLFGGEEESKTEAKKDKAPSQPVATTSRAEEKKPEKQAEPEKVEVAPEAMQVDEPQATTTTTVEAGKEVEEVEQKKDEAATEVEAPSQQLVFTYPLPQDEASRAEIKADAINVTYDAASKTINLTGLWSDSNNDSSSSSTVKSNEEHRGRKRSRSPKRSRVSDVDETTGEEITQPEQVVEEEDEYVEINPAPKTVSKSIRLPEGAKVDNLRAEITDEGFKVWI